MLQNYLSWNSKLFIFLKYKELQQINGNEIKNSRQKIKESKSINKLNRN